jgi:hypothetical protein
MNHLVILHKPYLDLILAGTKTVESRLSRRRHPAATRLRPGDALYLKQAGGDVRGRATAGTITEVCDIPPGGVALLAEQWWPRVVGGGPDDPYWLTKAEARHALFIELTDVRACHLPAAIFPRRLPWASGWIVGQPTDEILRLDGFASRSLHSEDNGVDGVE